MKRDLLNRLIALFAFVVALNYCHAESTIPSHSASEVFEQYKEALRKSGIALNGDFLDRNATFRATDLYALCASMPKGADLHVHGNALLPTAMQVEFVKDHLNELVVDCRPGDQMGTLMYIGDGTPCPEGYMTMADALKSGLTVDDFVRVWTVKGAGSQRVWDWFEGLFSKNTALTSSPALLEDFYTRVFTYYVSNGVSRIELKTTFFGSEEEALCKGRTLYRAMNKVRQQNPSFSVGIVGSGLKAKTETYDKTIYNDMLMENVIYVYQHIKDTVTNMADFVVGIDFLNEEDVSLPLTTFKPLIEKVKLACPDIHIELHAGESLRDDNDEIRSALELGAERIGHGFNLYKHQDVKSEVLKRGVTLSVCPISNHVLGYCPDLSQHPARQYIREGVRVAIADDDPAYIESNNLVDDFFAAIVYWDLSLDEVKTLARTSIEGAFMQESDRQQLLSDWDSQWRDFESKLQAK